MAHRWVCLYRWMFATDLTRGNTHFEPQLSKILSPLPSKKVLVFLISKFVLWQNHSQFLSYSKFWQYNINHGIFSPCYICTYIMPSIVPHDLQSPEYLLALYRKKLSTARTENYFPTLNSSYKCKNRYISQAHTRNVLHVYIVISFKCLQILF